VLAYRTAEFEVTLVGMEPMGLYWRTVFDVLPSFTCWLLNASIYAAFLGARLTSKTRRRSASCGIWTLDLTDRDPRPG
jgi:hypothetical protein